MSSGRTARLTGVAVPVDPLEVGVSRGCRRASRSRRTGSRCGSRGPKTTVPFDGSSDHVGNRPLAGGAGAVPAPLAPLRGSSPPRDQGAPPASSDRSRPARTPPATHLRVVPNRRC